jgi:hypothetical protein
VGGTARAARLARRAQRGGILTLLCLSIAICASVLFLLALRRDVDAAEFSRVDTSSARLDAGAGWVDPRWSDEVADRVAQLEAFPCDDAEAIARVAEELRALSFVAGVDQPEVLWPDGLRVVVRLRMPVACIRAGREYLPVCADGTLLSGAWPTPPARGPGFLPVIALDEVPSFRPGTALWSPDALDGLAVAVSMWEKLDDVALARLGRAVIDARRARKASVEEPGTVLLLENGRRVLFGRAPTTSEPGELPCERKWASLSNALAVLPDKGAPWAGPPCDWELVDVRWDVPEMLPRTPR